MRKRFLKIIIFILFLTIPKIGLTNSFFIDQEISEGNSFSAESLDFSLRGSNGFNIDGLKSGESASEIIKVKKEGGLDFIYRITAVETGGDDNFCRALNLEVKLGGAVKYSGDLFSLSLTPLPAISSSGEDDWNFSIGFSGDSYENKTCEFNLVFRGWQTDSDGTWGFFDEEILTNVVKSGSWITPSPTISPTSAPAPTPTPTAAVGRVVINEVFYDVDSSHQGGNEKKNEWIELYNAGTAAVDVSGWRIEDNHDFNILPTGIPSIPPDGFLVITPDASTWDYWPGIPLTAIKVVLSGSDPKIGNGLAKDDRVILKDKDGNIVDMVSWGSDKTAFNPSVPGVASGHSISRKIKGVDTDTAADWMDTFSGSTPPGPNPGTNPHNQIGEIVNLLLPPAAEPTLEMGLNESRDTVWFSINNLGSYDKLEYSLIYNSDFGDKEIIGSISLSGEETYNKDLRLGTCSAIEGRVCVLETGISRLRLKASLYRGSEIKVLEKEIGGQ